MRSILLKPLEGTMANSVDPDEMPRYHGLP